MSEYFENKVKYLPDEELLYNLQLQIQARQIDQQRRKDEVANQYTKYENQIKHLFVTLNSLSKRIWILINTDSYIDHYEILRNQLDYKKVENGQVFQKITNYLLTPKMDINSMLSLCNDGDKNLQLSQFVYLLSLFCYLYSNEMASLFVDFFLQVTPQKIEAFNQCFLLSPNIQIYFKTSLKPIFIQLRKNQKKEYLFNSLLGSLQKFSPLIPKFFIRVLKKSNSRGLIFYKLLKVFLSYYDAFGIASSEMILYYKSQIKGLSKMSRRYYINGSFEAFILDVLLSKENIKKNCSFVPCESSLKKIFPYLYRPFILVDKMSLLNFNTNSDFLFVYLNQSQQEIDIEQNKDNSILNQDIFDEMCEINKITKSSNFDSSSIFISKSNPSLNDLSGQSSTSDFKSSSDSYFITKPASNNSSETINASQESKQIKVLCRTDDVESQENRKIARKLFLRISKRFLSKANLVKIPNAKQSDHSYRDTSEIGKRTLMLFKKIADLSSVFKDPELEVEIDKLQIILTKYPMSINDLVSLFEENDLSTVLQESRIKQHDLMHQKSFDADDIDNDDIDDGLSDSILSSLSSNPLFALSLYEKQSMVLNKFLILLDENNKNSYKSVVFRAILKNTKLIENDIPTNSFIMNPPSFLDFYHMELMRLQKERTTAKFFDQSSSSAPASPSGSITSSLSSSSFLLSPLEVPYKSLLMIAVYSSGVYNRKEYPEKIKKYDKQLYKILKKDEGKKSFLGSLESDKSTKVFFDDLNKLRPFIDQLKYVFNIKKKEKSKDKSSDNIIKLDHTNSSVEDLDSNDNLGSVDNFSPQNTNSILDSITSSDVLSDLNLDSKKDPNSKSIILGLIVSNMDRAVMILTELLNANGAKESGMDQYLPLTILGIIYASPPNLHSVLYFLKNFALPILDDSISPTFTNIDKSNIMLLHSALTFFESK